MPPSHLSSILSSPMRIQNFTDLLVALVALFILNVGCGAAGVFMRRSSNFEQWRPKILQRGSILVTTRSGLSTALSDLGTSSDEEKDSTEEVEPVSPVKQEEDPVSCTWHGLTLGKSHIGRRGERTVL